jgi:hypothetical protein
MGQNVIAVIATLLLLVLFSPGGVSLGFAQEGSASTSKEGSGTWSRPAAAGSDSPQRSEGCKLGTYAGTIPLSHLQDYAPGDEDFRGGMTCTFRINQRLPLFTFHFAGEEDNTLGSFDITAGTSSKVIQTIDNTTDPNAIAPAKAQSVLAVVDANFDGYQDLQLMNQCGATGNCSYDFYLYDPKENRFVHNDFLSNLTTPSFDQSKKQVTASSNSSVSDWENETYRYQSDGRYTLIHKEVSEWDRKTSTVTVKSYELRNGKMELVDSTTTPQ